MRFRLLVMLAGASLVVAGLAGVAAAAPKAASSSNTLLIGQMVTESSPASPGTRNTASRDTLNAWAKMVNASGGINGMKVKAMIMDDGGDPAKASANVKSMIDAGVVAFVGSTMLGTQGVWMPIAAQAGVPVIGGGCYSASQNTDQNFFCLTTTAILDGLKAQTKFAADQGGKSFGITYASDIPAAAGAAPLFKSLAVADGMAFSEAIGLTNTDPDYTAACVTFKQANTTDVGIEAAPQIGPIARDCARQNYFPKWTSGDTQIAATTWEKDPNIKTAIAAIYSFPWFLSKGSTPEQTASLKQFQSTMKKYAPKVLTGDGRGGAPLVWTAATAFGIAAKTIPQGTAPTGALVTAGMNTFSGETLGGLAPNPLTFTAGTEHPHNSCWWGVLLKNHKYSAPNGMETTCTP